jgi:hypothetical protein
MLNTFMSIHPGIDTLILNKLIMFTVLLMVLLLSRDLNMKNVKSTPEKTGDKAEDGKSLSRRALLPESDRVRTTKMLQDSSKD